ncbi:MAG: metallophosphoesterase family protein [Ignisphaera sp.]|uniref:Calcineurin-like phosphoesterase domain-containing protein n=1 Tax=Ignisphaera aggregans TaxID=334771 RepID=A0A7J3MXP4_9CREN
MRILAISDIHSYVDLLRTVFEKEPGIEVVVFSGDIAPYQAPFKTLDLIKRAIDIAKMYKVELLIAVPGNIDIADHYDKIVDSVFVNLHKKFIEYREYIFMGLGGSNKTPFRSPFELQDEDIEKILMNIYNSLKNVRNPSKLVLVTHVPPYGTNCDRIYTGENVGSIALRKFIEIVRPLAIFCGHVHESRCVDKINETIVINPGPLSKGFYTIVDIDSSGIKVHPKSIK